MTRPRRDLRPLLTRYPPPIRSKQPVGRVARHQFGAAPATFGKGNGSKTVMMSRWKGMDEDISDDQQDIARGRNMVDSKFQGGFGLGGTHVSSLPIARVPPPRTFNRRRGRASALPAPARTAHKLRVSPSKTLWGFTQKSLPTQRSRAVVESN